MRTKSLSKSEQRLQDIKPNKKLIIVGYGKSPSCVPFYHFLGVLCYCEFICLFVSHMWDSIIETKATEIRFPFHSSVMEFECGLNNLLRSLKISTISTSYHWESGCVCLNGVCALLKFISFCCHSSFQNHISMFYSARCTTKGNWIRTFLCHGAQGLRSDFHSHSLCNGYVDN